jgi:hypothetical protein
MAFTTFTAGTTIKSAEINENFNLKADLASPTFTGTLTAALIMANTLSASTIVGTTITATSLVATTLTASSIQTTSITSSSINGTTITGASLVGTTLTVSNISFPATQVPSSNANTLDDYEEGTFTPTVYGTAVAGVGTYTTQLAAYTKVGRLVTIQIYMVWTAHTGSGLIRVTSLPFTINSTSNYFNCCYVVPSNIALTASNVIVAYFTPATTIIDLNQYPVGGGALASINMDTAGTLILSGSYIVD